MSKLKVTATVYEIKIKGYLDPSWADWFGGCVIIHQDEVTLLRCLAIDQAALLGILAKIAELNLTLLSLERKDGSQKIQ